MAGKIKGFLKAAGKGISKNKGKIGAGAGIGAGMIALKAIQQTEWYKQYDDSTRKEMGFEANEPTHLAYPQELDSPDYTEQNIIHFIIMERAGFRNIHNIYLPQPGSFQIGDSHSFTGMEENTMSRLGKGGIDAAADLINKVMNPGQLKQLGTSASIDSITSDIAVANTLATGGLPFIGDFADEIAFANAAVDDRNERMRFINSAVRTFSFDFTFQPRNAKEAVTVGNIILKLRRFSYPLKGINKLALNYPPEFLINFKHIQGEGEARKLVHNEHYPALLPAFLTGMTTDYNPNTLAHHRDGSPQAIKLSLAFTEVKRIIRDELEVLETMRLGENSEEMALFYSVNNEALNKIAERIKEGEKGGEGD